MWKKFVCLILLLSVAISAAGFFSPPKVKGRVEIEGVNLQGKTEREARDALSPLFSAWENRSVTLLLPDGSGITLPSSQIAVKTDFASVFSTALKTKKGESAALSLTPTFSLVNFPALTKEIANRFYLAPVNAKLTFSPNAMGSAPTFSVSEETPGRMVDEYALIKRVIAALPQLKNQESVTVSVPLKTLSPTLTKKELDGRHAKLSSFATAYSTSQAERKHNIALAAQKLHGVTLAPGQSLSFNARVGERTQEKGFLKAKVIERGAFTEGVGGGVCQVSGTLYNAAVLAGLSVTEYHQHSLAVSYLPPSRDAMVNYGTADLVIRNDFSHPVFLTAVADGTNLRFTFYGAPTGKTYALESVITGSIPTPEPLIEQDDGTLFPTLPQGERKVLQRGKDGILSECYLLITEKGKTKRVLLRQNKYLPVREHVILGGALPKNAPS